MDRIGELSRDKVFEGGFGVDLEFYGVRTFILFMLQFAQLQQQVVSCSWMRRKDFEGDIQES